MVHKVYFVELHFPGLSTVNAAVEFQHQNFAGIFSNALKPLEFRLQNVTGGAEIF